MKSREAMTTTVLMLNMIGDALLEPKKNPNPDAQDLACSAKQQQDLTQAVSKNKMFVKQQPAKNYSAAPGIEARQRVSRKGRS